MGYLELLVEGCMVEWLDGTKVIYRGSFKNYYNTEMYTFMTYTSPFDEFRLSASEIKSRGIKTIMLNGKNLFDGSFGEGCPICKTPWKETKFNMHVWYDCIPCGKRKEDIC